MRAEPAAEVARTAWARMRGLLGRRGLPAGRGLLIPRCGAIHTVGMRFAIDARFYDARGRLTRAALGIRPGRPWVWGGWRARCVLECAAGDPAFRACDDLSNVRLLA